MILKIIVQRNVHIEVEDNPHFRDLFYIEQRFRLRGFDKVKGKGVPL